MRSQRFKVYSAPGGGGTSLAAQTGMCASFGVVFGLKILRLGYTFIGKFLGLGYTFIGDFLGLGMFD